MNHLFNCSFCLFTKEKKNLVKEHEKKCPFNPKNKNCCSCTSYYSIFSGIKTTVSNCLKNHPDFKTIFENETSCDLYTPEKQE